MTWPSSGQSKNALWLKTETLLRCGRWWSGLTSYFTSWRPLALKSTSRSQKLRQMTGQLLKQYHARFYCFYKKGSTRDMIGLHGLHSNVRFWCSNMAASIGLKSFCSWCFKLGGNMETIATHLREVHYRLAIACNVCQLLGSISAQVVLEHQSGCRMKSHRKSKVKKQEQSLFKPASISPAGWKDTQDFPSDPANEHGLI